MGYMEYINGWSGVRKSIYISNIIKSTMKNWNSNLKKRIRKEHQRNVELAAHSSIYIVYSVA